MSPPPLFERIAADAHAEVGEDPAGSSDVEGAVAALARAAAAEDDDTALLAFDDAGARHDLATLDTLLERVVARGPLAFLRGGRRRRLREVARGALARTRRPGSVRLAAALLGAVGGRDDIAALETVAAHPAFTLHGATALASMPGRDALAALLRLIPRTSGESRVVVVDRLLAHVREPAVRLALARDALTGLDDASAREIAPAIVGAVDLRALAADEAAPADLRASVARLLALAAPP